MTANATTIDTPTSPEGVQVVANYIGGAWRESTSETFFDVIDPSSGRVTAVVPDSTQAEVDDAVAAAAAALPGWRATPATTRAEFILRYRMEVERRIDDIVDAIARDAGKATADARAEVLRSISALDNALSVPMTLRGHIVEQVATSVDTETVRQPVGVCAMISPFNFPMFSSVAQQSTALVCGNTLVWKPSEQTPLANQVLFDIIDSLGLPPGVWNLVNGGRDVVNMLIDAPDVAAVSSVSSAQAARAIYARAAGHGKRVQALGGAKNHMVVMPDAVVEGTATQIVQSGFGFAGQRCMAGSVIVAVGDAWRRVGPEVVRQAGALKLGPAAEPGTDLGPVISATSKERITAAVGRAEQEGARIAVDGRDPQVDAAGYFLAPTIVEGVEPTMAIAREELFGPVLAVIEVADIDEAIALINASEYGNGTTIFTESGAAVRKFRAEVEVGMIGVNVGVAAPASMFPFSGWKSSLCGDIPIQAESGVDFFTRRKVVTTRWLS
ncbi:MAG TPA: CoA-acylating methylmalonate-semialdehyde dehydrogenase [Nocardioides sp.]|nr:CoA-acylating methylmalonate-semialdehyde dehydrogenase [Nocardioides sp.]